MSLSDTALRLIERNGQEASLISVSEGTYNTSTGEATLTETGYAVSVYVMDMATSQARFGTDATSVVAYLAGKSVSVAPRPGDRLMLAVGIEYVIAEVESVNAKGVIVLYTLRLKAN